MFSKKANAIFIDAITQYNDEDSLGNPFINKYDKNQDLISHLLFRKCWIDAVQWSYEDIIRDPHIDSTNSYLVWINF